jgi:GntR family carbon starvation induced transcriptional regulator
MDDTHRSGTLAEEVFARLRTDIIGGEFAPGSRLAMDSMCSRYGVGISPLREALARLATNGLVNQESQRGFRVREISLPDLMDIAATRALLEGRALRQSIRQGDDAWEARVVSSHHLLAKIDPRRIGEASLREQWELRHREFHFTILSACGSPWLLRLCAVLYDQFDFYRRLARFAGKRQPRLAGQHGKLVAAVTGRKAAAAAAILEQHIGETAEAVSRELKLATSADARRGPAGKRG